MKGFGYKNCPKIAAGKRKAIRIEFSGSMKRKLNECENLNVENTYRSKFMDYTILYEEEVESTNLWAKKLAQKGMPQGMVCIADAQSAGVGRRGRSWASEGGHSIYMSILLRPDLPASHASMLTLAAGLSVAQVCRTVPCSDKKNDASARVSGNHKEAVSAKVEQNGPKESMLDTKCASGTDGALFLDAEIKWPNDVVVSGKKICGILTEMGLKGASVDYVIVGIGINVNAKQFPKEIQETATSLALEAGMDLDRKRIVEAVLEQFSINYKKFLETKDLTMLVDAYNEVLVNRDREVRVLDPKGEYRGVAAGINELGELLVRKEDGTEVAVYAGEVSVRGIYGYV